jgi:hypothetical protein
MNNVAPSCASLGVAVDDTGERFADRYPRADPPERILRQLFLKLRFSRLRPSGLCLLAMPSLPRCDAVVNPNGVAAFSPGLLAAGKLPWVSVATRFVQPHRGCIRIPVPAMQPRWGRNPALSHLTQGRPPRAANPGLKAATPLGLIYSQQQMTTEAKPKRLRTPSTINALDVPQVSTRNYPSRVMGFTLSR